MLSAVIPSRHSYPALPLARQPVHQRSVRPGPLVLGTASINPPTPTTDTDRTVSRRSEPSSRTALTGEQPDPWDLLQPQDAMSRHRGAKPPRRCELSGAISLLSPAYLLSVERRPFHSEPGSLTPAFAPARLVGLAVKLPCAPPLPFRRRPPQSNCPPDTVPVPASRDEVRSPTSPGWYFTDGSTSPGGPVSQPPTYATQVVPKSNVRVQ